MFDNLSERLERSFKILKGEGKITEINVAETLKAGEQIVSSGVHHIEDGEIVKPLSPVTNTNIGGLL